MLEKFGFEYKRQKGSHVKYSNDSKITIIPMHDEVRNFTHYIWAYFYILSSKADYCI
ncbi:MAG: type II toxin-antitoxin system HicA family toxin [Tissierellia bacterium]|nr:type II toxin-antitoxin system HicA family toxin [Tissierellia bacterium]MDD3751675.1 type II toxin-antitoxin system HicA family toxin [Tissierellia bacterium]